MIEKYRRTYIVISARYHLSYHGASIWSVRFYEKALAKIFGDHSTLILNLNSVGEECAENLIGSLSQDEMLVTFGASSGNPLLNFNSWNQLFKIITKSFWRTTETKTDPVTKL